MGIIEIEEMDFFAYHGCFEEEKIIGNKFTVYIRIETDCRKAAVSDNLQDALNYQLVYQLIKKEMEIKSNLLEHVAERIIYRIQKNFHAAQHVRVKISKMNPPIEGVMKCVSVTLESERANPVIG